MNAIDPWARQVEEATNGKVRVEILYSQTLTQGKDPWGAAKEGIADISWCFHGYWAGMTPLTDVIRLPALPFQSAEKGSEVLWKLYEKFPPIQKEFADNKVLLLYTSNPYTFINTAMQVQSIDEMSGMKNRMLVNGSMGVPWEAIYFAETPVPVVYFSLSMTRRKWDSLDKEIQDAIMSVSGLKGSKFWGRNCFDTTLIGFSEIVGANGKDTGINPWPDVKRKWWPETSGKPIWEQWVNKMRAEGYDNAQEILDAAISFSRG